MKVQYNVYWWAVQKVLFTFITATALLLPIVDLKTSQDICSTSIYINIMATIELPHCSCQVDKTLNIEYLADIAGCK